MRCHGTGFGPALAAADEEWYTVIVEADNGAMKLLPYLTAQVAIDVGKR